MIYYGKTCFTKIEFQMTRDDDKMKNENKISYNAHRKHHG